MIKGSNTKHVDPSMDCRALASAVLMQAVHDADCRPFACNRDIPVTLSRTVRVLVPNRDVEGALAFLCAPSPILRHWCDVLNVSMDKIVERSLHVYRGKRAAIHAAGVHMRETLAEQAAWQAEAQAVIAAVRNTKRELQKAMRKATRTAS